MYTEPSHRRGGLARRLMEEMIGWCRALYASLGFTPTNEMSLGL